jgi:hypothetical protein
MHRTIVFCGANDFDLTVGMLALRGGNDKIRLPESGNGSVRVSFPPLLYSFVYPVCRQAGLSLGGKFFFVPGADSGFVPSCVPAGMLAFAAGTIRARHRFKKWFRPPKCPDLAATVTCI